MTKMTSLGFKFMGHGIWVNEEAGVSIKLNEDYRKTFTAHRNVRPYYNTVMSPAGRATRFRSAEAAAAFLMRRPENKVLTIRP